MIEATLGLNNMSENSDALNRKKRRRRLQKKNKISKHRVTNLGFLRRGRGGR